MKKLLFFLLLVPFITNAQLKIQTTQRAVLSTSATTQTVQIAMPTVGGPTITSPHWNPIPDRNSSTTVTLVNTLGITNGWTLPSGTYSNGNGEDVSPYPSSDPDFPNDVLGNQFYTSFSCEVHGLTVGASYTIKTANWDNSSGSNTIQVRVVGSTTTNQNVSYDNTTLGKTNFTGITPRSDGVIIISLSGGPGFEVINGIIISGQ